MKVYFHREQEPAFTKRILVDPSKHVTIRDLVQEFLSALSTKFQGISLDVDSLSVLDEHQKPISLSAKVQKALSDYADVFVETKQPAVPAVAAPQQTSAPTARSSPAPSTPAASNKPKPTGHAPAHASSNTASSQPSKDNQVDNTPAAAAAGTDDGLDRERAAEMLQQYVDKAVAAADAANYRLAGNIFSQLLDLLPKAPELLERAAYMWLHQARLPERAEPLARQLASCLPNSSTAHQMLGDCFVKLGKPDDAVRAYNTAVTAARKKQEGEEREDDLKVCMAQALFACPDTELKDTASQIVMDVLRRREAHWEGLRLYAQIAESQGMYQDALRVGLRLLVTRSKDADVRALIARRLQEPDGLTILYDELSVAPGQSVTVSNGQNDGSSYGSGMASRGTSNAAALAFLGTCVKDHSAVDATIKLLSRANELDPLQTGYALNLSHAWELKQQLWEVVQVAGLMFSRAAESGSPELTLGGGVDLQVCADLLLSLPPLKPAVTSLDWRRADRPASTPAAETAKAQTQDKVLYDTSQLDLLALAFTAAKALYLGGAVATAARLVLHLEAARQASQQPLHTTVIRNEAAYFGCVLQLARDFPPDPLPTSSPAAALEAPVSNDAPAAGGPAAADQPGQVQQATAAAAGGGSGVMDPKPLYLVGDSHCLSAAWRCVRLRGAPRVLHPVLITGCKIWHLRPTSTFYPKAQFAASMAALPRGAQLVMVLGEIDCREGLMMAVQKCRYNTTVDAVSATITIYLDVLLGLIRKHGFELFVHPVPPVLNETRSIVTLFNESLKSQVLAAAAKPSAAGKLHFLDFTSHLLTPDGTGLAAELDFDGTHLSPVYLTHLAQELERVT